MAPVNAQESPARQLFFNFADGERTEKVVYSVEDKRIMSVGANRENMLDSN
jgi:hypothetical protein